MYLIMASVRRDDSTKMLDLPKPPMIGTMECGRSALEFDDYMQGPPDIQSKSLSAQIYAQLKYQLMAARLQPGDRLKIRDMAQSLGTSETPVREALLQLVRDGALQGLRLAGALRCAEWHGEDGEDGPRGGRAAAGTSGSDGDGDGDGAPRKRRRRDRRGAGDSRTEPSASGWPRPRPCSATSPRDRRS